MNMDRPSAEIGYSLQPYYKIPDSQCDVLSHSCVAPAQAFINVFPLTCSCTDNLSACRALLRHTVLEVSVPGDSVPGIFGSVPNLSQSMGFRSEGCLPGISLILPLPPSALGREACWGWGGRAGMVVGMLVVPALDGKKAGGGGGGESRQAGEQQPDKMKPSRVCENVSVQDE